MQIVLDTNVLVSGLLKRYSKPEQIIDAILMRKIHLVIDERVFKEYQDVLHRPKLNIPKDRADAVLSFIAFSSVHIPVKSHTHSGNMPHKIGRAHV